MGNLNEIQKQTTQSYGDNSFTTTIKENTVEFDSAKDSFTFNDEVNVPSLKVNGQEITPSEPQVQADWNQATSTGSDYIKNKPKIKAGQGVNSIIEGGGTTASGNYSHAEGINTTASGDGSHAEGVGTASGSVSHAEGGNTTASGSQSHAEGGGTTASGFSSHAEGGGTTASGPTSHAEGASTTATGDYSHTEGYQTIANNKCQHVFGEYNGVDPSSALSSARGTYIEIVGNGTTTTNRSNARTLDWSGNEMLAGNLTIGGTITSNGQQILPQKQTDWNQTTSTGSDYILNKPAIKAGQGENSIIEGSGTTASGSISHAEGSYTTASGYTSHAEGNGSTASGSNAHAEGGGTKAIGAQSHAEGSGSTASGSSSHAEGLQTIANHKSQHVFGEYNVLDPSTTSSDARGNYVEIVGKGTGNTARSNARTLDWAGNEMLTGTLTIGGASGATLKVESGALKVSFDGGATWLTVSAS